MDANKNKIGLVIAVVVVLALVGGAIAYFMRKSNDMLPSSTSTSTSTYVFSSTNMDDEEVGDGIEVEMNMDEEREGYYPNEVMRRRYERMLERRRRGM